MTTTPISPPADERELIAALEDVFAQALDADAILKAKLDGLPAVDATIDDLFNTPEAGQWIVIVWSRASDAILGVNAYADAKKAVAACRDLDTESAGKLRGELHPAGPLTAREIVEGDDLR
jgi:hypothetical protein